MQNLILHEKLPPHELRWVKQLAKLFAEIPPSLTLATSGEGLRIWDTEYHSALREKDASDADNGMADGELAYIPHPIVHGVS